jgi:diguanylate cyclase (GGDEF)-like protein
MKVETTLKLAAGLVVLVMATVALIPYFFDARVNAAMTDLTKAAQHERSYQALIGLLRDAESGQRGFVITGREDYLQPYYAALSGIPVTTGLLRDGIGSAAERAEFKRIEAAIETKLGEMAETIRVRRERGLEEATAIVNAGRGKSQMEILRTLIKEQVAEHAERRTELRETIAADSRRAASLAIGATVANIAALCTMLLAAHGALRKSRAAEDEARRSALALEASAQLALRNNERLASTAEMMNLLDLAGTQDEASEIISRYFQRLLPGLSGSLYLYRNSRDLLERKAVWGGGTGDPEILEVHDCWGLRRGGAYFTLNERALHCQHAEATHLFMPRLCLPMVSQEEVIGSMTVLGHALAGPEGEAMQRWVGHLGGQVALALANVQLRLSLKRQSIIDPLTELYNRRYMDEVLIRELARAGRKGTAVSLILVDLDHFKRVNDTYGHDAGDLLLRKVGQVLRQSVRNCDVACRFGGEELVLILPECELAAALVRAEAVRVAVAAICISSKGEMLEVSASLGVASSGPHGDDAEALLRAADTALYAAKQGGRNRVVSASPPERPDSDALAAKRTATLHAAP